jgi:hypothetical protein
MEKMRFESVDGFQENIRRLSGIFPSCGKKKKRKKKQEIFRGRKGGKP